MLFTLFLSEQKVKTNEGGKEAGMWRLTSEQSTEINISKIEVGRGRDALKSNAKVIFICLLNYLLTDNKGGIYVAV